MSVFGAVLNRVNLLDVPHHCLSCGAPMSFGISDGGRWFACCPRMWIDIGDGQVEHNYPGHSYRLLARRPVWTCDHEHMERHPLQGYPV